MPQFLTLTWSNVYHGNPLPGETVFTLKEGLGHKTFLTLKCHGTQLYDMILVVQAIRIMVADCLALIWHQGICNHPIELHISTNHINGLVQDCINSSALAMELLQSCTKSSTLGSFQIMCLQFMIPHLVLNQNVYFLLAHTKKNILCVSIFMLLDGMIYKWLHLMHN